MRYEGTIYRPPSEADAYILQATIGCSWNACTYCDMYRLKQSRVRALDETLADVERARERLGARVEKVFVADGDALVLDLAQWEAILEACRAAARADCASSTSARSRATTSRSSASPRARPSPTTWPPRNARARPGSRS